MATEIDQLSEEAEALLGEMEELEGKLQDVETDEERESLESKLEAKDQEIDEKLKVLQRAKARKGKSKQLSALRDELATDDNGKSMAPDGDDPEPEADKTPAKAKDHEKEKREIEQVFAQYLQGKDISGQARAALEPQSPNWEEGKDGMKIPDHLLGPILGDRWAKSMQLGKTMLSSDADDASLVDEDYRAELIELEPEPGHLLGRVTVVPTDTGTIRIPRLQQTDSDEHGSVSFSWIDEGGTKPETEPEFEQVTVETHECAGYTEMSKAMMSRSSIGLVALLRRLYRQAANAEIDNMILGGDGVGEPLGIINTAGVRTVGRAAAGDVQKEDFVNLKHEVLPHHRDQAAWVIHDDVEQELELEELDTAATNERFFTGDGEILNFPYEVTMRQPAIGSDGDVIYGDPSWYFLAQEREMVIETSRHYKFRDNLQAFVLYMLIGGRLVAPRSMAILVSAGS